MKKKFEGGSKTPAHHVCYIYKQPTAGDRWDGEPSPKHENQRKQEGGEGGAPLEGKGEDEDTEKRG